jgi:hypothetical protein
MQMPFGPTPFPRPALTFLCAAAALLAGCGSGAPTASVTLPNLTGNWQIQAAGTPPNLGLILSGSMQSQKSVLSGTMMLTDLNLPNPCGLSTPIALAGTESFDSGIVLKSQTFLGSELTVSLDVPSYSNDIVTGTIAITGPVCNYPPSSAVAAQIARLNGNFSGSIGSANALQSEAAVLAISETESPAANGQFPVTGSLQVNGSFCNVNYQLAGYTSGTYLTLAAPPDMVTGIIPVTIIGYSNTAATQLSDAAISFAEGPCSTGVPTYDTYSGTLTLQ